jgi:hypothetical protein
VGDFNEIVVSAENRGAAARSPRQMEAFQSALKDSQFCDLGYCGPKYTWNRAGSELIQESLNRGVVNKAWMEMFGRNEVPILVSF